MQNDRFQDLMQNQFDRCKSILEVKAEEYATEDRLHNFHVAAGLHQLQTRMALAGMMAKHTVSIYDMCWSDDLQPFELWEEKIDDHINYLILLKAIIIEELETEFWEGAKNA